MEKNKDLKEMIKNNPKFAIGSCIILIILIVIIFYGIFYSKPSRIIIEAKSTKEKVVQKNELRTVTYTYNGIAKQCKNECKNDGKDTYLYFVSYKGTVTAGIDFNKLEYEKNDLEIEKRKIEIAINNFTIQQNELFEILYMSKRVRVSRQEIMSRLHISKSTYYDLKKSLIISAINSLHQDILIEEIYKKMVN